MPARKKKLKPVPPPFQENAEKQIKNLIMEKDRLNLVIKDQPDQITEGLKKQNALLEIVQNLGSIINKNSELQLARAHDARVLAVTGHENRQKLLDQTKKDIEKLLSPRLIQS